MEPVASLSLDADNQWAYQMIRGRADWRDAESYLPAMVRRVLELLGTRDWRATFFLVGRDADADEDAAAFAELAAAGHEIGNHSYRHEPWLHRYGETELEEELGRAEVAITAATGVLPVGFRGPGYSVSERALRVLRRRGYRYDASTLPTVVGPLARAVYFRAAALTPAQRAERRELYGTFHDARRPVGPYRWSLDDAMPGDTTPEDTALVELPVTVLPFLRLPIHVSYLLTLSAYSDTAARAYLRGALRVCRAAGVEPSVLLHPLDLLSGEDVPDLRFFPGMQIPASVKLHRVGTYLDLIGRSHQVVTVGEHVERAAARGLRARRPDFAA